MVHIFRAYRVEENIPLRVLPEQLSVSLEKGSARVFLDKSFVFQCT